MRHHELACACIGGACTSRTARTYPPPRHHCVPDLRARGGGGGSHAPSAAARYHPHRNRSAETAGSRGTAGRQGRDHVRRAGIRGMPNDIAILCASMPAERTENGVWYYTAGRHRTEGAWSDSISAAAAVVSWATEVGREVRGVGREVRGVGTGVAVGVSMAQRAGARPHSLSSSSR